jgi:hypothetical protein
MTKETLPIEQAVKRFPSIRGTVKFATEKGAKIVEDKPVRNHSGRVIDHLFKVKTGEGYQTLNKCTLMLMVLICTLK